MNEKIKQHLAAFAQKKGWGTDDATLIEILTENKALYEETVSERRWWNDTFRVVEVDGMLIGYKYASATGDTSLNDLGWEFNPSTICEVKPVQKTVTIYERVNPALKESVTNTMEPITKQSDELKKEDSTQESAATESAAQDSAMEATQDSEEGSTEG